MTELEQLVRELPPDLRREVQHFVEFLIEKQRRTTSGSLKLDWRGALRDWRDKYTSVELQHKSTEWWGE